MIPSLKISILWKMMVYYPFNFVEVENSSAIIDLKIIILFIKNYIIYYEASYNIASPFLWFLVCMSNILFTVLHSPTHRDFILSHHQTSNAYKRCFKHCTLFNIFPYSSSSLTAHTDPGLIESFYPLTLCLVSIMPFLHSSSYLYTDQIPYFNIM